MTRHAPALGPGVRIGPYEVVEHLGQGAMGAVWKARHADLRHHVVIKVLLPEHAADDDTYQRFLREGEAVARIRHPHVVEVHDVGVYGNLPYLVMELLEGETLGARFARERTLTETELADVMVPVCAAVSLAHEEGVVHRDLKPDNLFLVRVRGTGVHPKVLDFGISRVVDDRSGRIKTQTDTVMGTPLYMSPEQARGESPIDDRSDQYSLGVILYEGLTGRTPVPDDTMFKVLAAVARGEFPPPRALRPGVDARFEAVVLTALSAQRGTRFASVRALGAALLPFASDRVRLYWAPTFGVSSAPVEGAVDMGKTVDEGHAYVPGGLVADPPWNAMGSAGGSAAGRDAMTATIPDGDNTTTVRRVVRRRRVGWGMLAVIGLAAMAVTMLCAWAVLRG